MKTKQLFKNLKAVTLLVALSLSIVSCQEFIDSILGSSVDDPVPTAPTTGSETGIDDDISTLYSQIANLEQHIAVLEVNNMDVTQLKKDLDALKKEINDNKNKTEKDIKNWQSHIEALDEQIKKACSTTITNIVLQETLDCVVGTINLPGFDQAILAAYVGENWSGMPEFPISGSDYNIDPNGYSLRAVELPEREDQYVGNNGKNSYLINGIGNAGMLYFTINPRKIDPSTFNFSILSSTYETLPIKLSDVIKSDHQITYFIGKRGNRLTRIGNDDPFIVPPSVNVENKITYLYEAKVTYDLDVIEKAYYYNDGWRDGNLWNAGYNLTGTTQSADANALNMFGRYQFLVEAVKSKSIEKELQASLKILQDFYNGVYKERTNMSKQSLRIMWDDGYNDVISGFGLSSVIINPLNFKQIFLLDNVSMSWSFKNYEKELGDLAKTIQANASGVTSVTLKSVSMDGTQPKLTFTAGDTDVVVDITEEVYNAINNGMELASLGNIVNSILHPYQKASSTSSDILTRVNYFLDNKGANVMIEQGGNVAWNGVEPILLFENSEGITQLHSNMTINGSGITTFIMTSLSEEYIVPAYMKYIAIIQNGSVLESYSVEGKEKLAQLSLPIGESEIVYQVSDFYGNIVTKRYTVNRKQ